MSYKIVCGYISATVHADLDSVRIMANNLAATQNSDVVIQEAGTQLQEVVKAPGLDRKHLAEKAALEITHHKNGFLTLGGFPNSCRIKRIGNNLTVEGFKTINIGGINISPEFKQLQLVF